ncbi:MAG: hypothetical protein PWQ55_2368 [Chloroflexota bacterium]|nr:hypothetical protein [Chloroflexota bacterium]
MSFLDDLNRLIDPLKKIVLTGPAHELFSEKSAMVTFMCQQTGNQLSITADYVRENQIVYLMIDPQETCWKNLETGANVKLWLEGKEISGWAEGLKGYDEFLRILSNNEAKKQELRRRYANLESDQDLQDIQKLQPFLDATKLIRVKLTRLP